MGKHGFLYGKVRKVFHIYDWVKMFRGSICKRCGKKLVRDKKTWPDNGKKGDIYCERCFGIIRNGFKG